MKKNSLLFIYLISNLIYSQTNFIFNDLANLNSKRGLIATSSNSTHLFVSNGFTPTTDASRDIEIFNIYNNKWSILSNSTIEKRYASMECIGNSLYIFNGQNSFSINQKFEKIDITNGNITFLANNPYPTYSAGNCVWNNEIYFFGGSNSSGFSNKLLKYNIDNDNWTELKEMSIAKETRGEVVNGKIYSIAGYNGSQGTTSIDAYDIQSNTWQQMLSLPIGISAHSTAVFEDKILIIGDYSNLTNIGYYDIPNNSYISCTSNMIGRRHFGAETVNEKLYLIGGNQTPYASSALNSLQSTDLSSTLSILENNLKSFYISPNPSSDFLYIQYNGQIDELEIYNIAGKSVLKKNNLISPYKLNISNLNLGVYFLTVKSGNSIVSKKIIKK